MIFAVCGLGNIGDLIVTAWLRTGAKVIGIDISKNLLDEITQGISHKKEPFVSNTSTKYLKNKNFEITLDEIQASKKSNIKIIAIPVDFNKNKINFDALISISKNIASELKKKMMLLLSVLHYHLVL